MNVQLLLILLKDPQYQCFMGICTCSYKTRFDIDSLSDKDTTYMYVHVCTCMISIISCCMICTLYISNILVSLSLPIVKCSNFLFILFYSQSPSWSWRNKRSEREPSYHGALHSQSQMYGLLRKVSVWTSKLSSQ